VLSCSGGSVPAPFRAPSPRSIHSKPCLARQTNSIKRHLLAVTLPGHAPAVSHSKTPGSASRSARSKGPMLCAAAATLRLGNLLSTRAVSGGKPRRWCAGLHCTFRGAQASRVDPPQVGQHLLLQHGVRSTGELITGAGAVLRARWPRRARQHLVDWQIGQRPVLREVAQAQAYGPTGRLHSYRLPGGLRASLHQFSMSVQMQGCVYPRFSECPQAAGPFAARLRQSQRSLAEAQSRGGASACREYVAEGPGWLAQARVLRRFGPGLWAYGGRWEPGNGPAVARAARAHGGARAGRRQGELVRLGRHGVAEGAVRRRLAAAGPAPGLLVAYCGPW